MDTQIAIDNWGKDHWSLLAFFETQVVEKKNAIDVRKIRINDSKRGFGNGNGHGWKDSWGTRLKNGSILGDHDDIDVMNELEAEGFCINMFTDLNPIIDLTEKGLAVVADIRKHKSRGGNFSNFIYQELKYLDSKSTIEQSS
jgi:hypothetical protein